MSFHSTQANERLRWRLRSAAICQHVMHHCTLPARQIEAARYGVGEPQEHLKHELDIFSIGTETVMLP